MLMLNDKRIIRVTNFKNIAVCCFLVIGVSPRAVMLNSLRLSEDIFGSAPSIAPSKRRLIGKDQNAADNGPVGATNASDVRAALPFAPANDSDRRSRHQWRIATTECLPIVGLNKRKEDLARVVECAGASQRRQVSICLADVTIEARTRPAEQM